MRKYDVFEDRAVASVRLCLGGTSPCVRRMFFRGFPRKRRCSRRKRRVFARLRQGPTVLRVFSLFLYTKISRYLPPCAAAIWHRANAVNRGSTCGRIVSLLICKNCEKTCKKVGGPTFLKIAVSFPCKTAKKYTQRTHGHVAQGVRKTVIVSMKSWQVMGEVLCWEIAFRCLEVVLAK